MSDVFTKEQFSTEVLEDTLVEEKQANLLVVHNDDVNTFDWVIQSLVEVCDHTEEQAEQCSIIIHYKGKASVQEGEYESLDPMKGALLDRGITATID